LTTTAAPADASAFAIAAPIPFDAQWFYNGANFLAFKVAGNFLHPLMVATLRFSVAALILLPFALARWRRPPASARELGRHCLDGRRADDRAQKPRRAAEVDWEAAKCTG
jgi:drug/metabolite transporter (DMT)-like permease